MFGPPLIAAGITVTLLALGAAPTDVGPWYRALSKPPWNPPNWVFAPAWTIILSLAACAGVLAWKSTGSSDDHLKIGVLFAINIGLYVLWSPLFFNLKRPDLAAIDVVFLWLSIAVLILAVMPTSRLASVLLAPYLGWVTFAAWLNFTIVRLNRRP